MAKKTKQSRKNDPATSKFMEAQKIVGEHPLFAPLVRSVGRIGRSEGSPFPRDGYAVVTEGSIYAHPKRHAEVDEWVYVTAHCLLHLGLGHFQKKERQDLWNIACDITVAKFLADFKLGRAPRDENLHALQGLNMNTEEQIYNYLLENGVDKRFSGFGTGNQGEPDMLFEQKKYFGFMSQEDWTKAFGIGLRDAVTSAVNVAGGEENELGAKKRVTQPPNGPLTGLSAKP